MHPRDKAIVARFASGDAGARKYAVEAYYRSLSLDGVLPNCPFQRFMSEVESSCPDLNLRATYRARVLKE
jgi:hypothetical protein